MINFLFWLFFIGIGIASLQDLKRREVDNWLNLFLLVSSFAFVFFSAIFSWDYSIVVFASFSLLITFILANLFYYGRVFAGGDAKLLFVMAALFVGSSFIESVSNIGIFVILLMVSGSLWGLCFGGFLLFKNLKNAKKEFFKIFEWKLFLFILVFFVVFCSLYFLNWIFLFLGIFVFLGYFLILFAKVVEKGALVRMVNSKDLREGDWLVKDVRVGKKVIESSWEGLGLKDLRILKKLKKKVKIKEGIPFVPGFFIALVLYYFRENILGLFYFFI